MRHGPEEIYDQILVLQCQDRDTRAFSTLFERWSPRLLRHAYRMTGDSDLAGDVAQEAWMNIIKGINRLRDPATFPAWAFRITSRRAADAVRRRQRDRTATAAMLHSPIASALPGERTEATDEHDELRRALRTLSLNDQAILVLHYVEALNVRDLCRVFDIPRGTVKSRLYHAREKLRAALLHSTTHTGNEVRHEQA